MPTCVQRDDISNMRDTIHKITEFVVLFETAEEKLKSREKALEEKISKARETIDSQLNNIQSTLQDFQEIMTEAGAARWRIAAEQANKKNEVFLDNVRSATDQFIRCTDESFTRLNRATEYTVKGLSKTLHSFKMDDFQTAANQSIEIVRGTCERSVLQINKVIDWFHWRNIALALSITLVVTMLTGLYTTDEWPWESHQHVMQQRRLASAVEASWSHLSSTDKKEILQTAAAIDVA